MPTLRKRATRSQMRMYRAIAGAVRNAAHAHGVSLPFGFDESVAKRATGTLTSQWEEVLASRRLARRTGSHEDGVVTGKPKSSGQVEHPSHPTSQRDRRSSNGGPSLRRLWKEITITMAKAKRLATPEEYLHRIWLLRIISRIERGQSVRSAVRIDDGPASNGPMVDAGLPPAAVGVIHYPCIARHMLSQNEDVVSANCHGPRCWVCPWKTEPVASEIKVPHGLAKDFH